MGLRLVFFGSPQEAVPGLEAVLEAGHRVAAVYTRPDRQAGRSRRSRPTPVRVAAESRGLRVETPAGLRSPETVRQLEQFAADAFVVVAYGRILPPDILAIPRLGVVNIHPSLLPRRRGPSPVAAAILEGDAQTGVTLMLLDEGMDSGPLLLQPSPVLLDGSERTGELTARLFEIGAQQLSSVLDMLDSGTITPRQQDESAATVTRLVEKADGEIDWSKPAIEIERMTRAYDPWPGAFTSLNGKGLKITGATLLSGADGVAAGGKSPVPGTVSVRAHRLFVATGEGELEILQAQPEGRKPMSARDLLNGQPGLSGAVLGR